MTRLQKEYGPRGFQALAVAFNPMANMLVPDFVRPFQVGYPVGYAAPETVHDYLQVPLTFRLMVPQLVYIDRRGTIRAQTPPLGSAEFTDEKNIRAMIEKLLGEPAATKKAVRAKKPS